MSQNKNISIGGLMKQLSVLKTVLSDCLLIEESDGKNSLIITVNPHNDPTQPIHINISIEDGEELLQRLVDCLADVGYDKAIAISAQYYD